MLHSTQKRMDLERWGGGLLLLTLHVCVYTMESRWLDLCYWIVSMGNSDLVHCNFVAIHQEFYMQNKISNKIEVRLVTLVYSKTSFT